MKHGNQKAFRALKAIAAEAKRLLVDHLCEVGTANSTQHVTVDNLARVSTGELNRLFRACSYAERAGVDLGVGPPLNFNVFHRKDKDLVIG